MNQQTILSHSDDESLGSESDSREELFDSSLDTVNVSVNTELPMDFSHGSEEEEFDFFHIYEELSDYDFHRMMSVDDFTYSTAFSNEVFDNGEWYTYAGLETCNIMKSTRHGKELLCKSIQSTIKKGDSGIDNLTCLSGDDTKLGTEHTKADVYESSYDMSEGKSISECQSESDSDLEDDFFSVTEEIEIFSENDDGEYFSAEESLEGTLDASFKSIPCTVVSYQDNLGLNDLDPSTVVRSSEVPDPSDKWEDVDVSSLCIFNELPLEPCDNEVMFSRPIGFDGSSTDAIDYAKDFLRRQSTLENLLSAKSRDDCDDANSIWSILTDKLLYCQSDTSDSVRLFSYDSLKVESAKQRFFNAALSNEPCLGKSYINSCNMAELYRDQLYDTVPIPSKKKLNTAEATASSNEPIGKIVFPQYVEDRYQDLEINTSYKYNPETSICTTYLWTENVGYPKDFVTATAYHTEGYKLWFKQGRFPIGIDGEATAHLLDDTPIPVKTLIDSGASRPILSRHFYDNHPFLHTYPRYKIPPRDMVVGNDTVLPCDEAIAIMVKFSGHVFHMICYLMEVSKDYGLYIGQKAMYELEGGADFRNLSFHFLMRSLNLYAGDTVKIKPGQTKVVPMFLDTHAIERDMNLGEKRKLGIDLYSRENEKVIVNLKTERKDGLVQTLPAVMSKGTISLTAVNNTDIEWKIDRYQLMGSLDCRSFGYFHISRHSLQRIMSDNANFLNDRETVEYFNILMEDHKNVMKFAQETVLQRQKIEAERNTQLKSRQSKGKEDFNDSNMSEDNNPYPWLDKDDPRRNMTDRECLDKYIDLSDSDITEGEKRNLYKVLYKYKKAFSLRDEIGLCQSMEVELELKDETPFFIRAFPIKENDKDIVDKEMRTDCLLGILKKGMSSYSSRIMLIPRKLSRIPRIVTDFRHLNSRLVTLQPSIPLIRDAFQILGASGCEILSLADLRDAYHTLKLSERSKKFCGITPYYGSDSYLYQRLGMGLSVSSAIWQNFIQKVLQEIPYHRKNHLAIMDDCLVFSKKYNHLKHLTDLFKALIRNGLKISPRKCKLFKTSLVYMGHQVSIIDGIPHTTPVKSRVDAIVKLGKEDKGEPSLVLCISGKYIPTVLYQYHTPLLAGHPGVFKLYDTIKQRYYFPGMFNLVREFVECCLECQSMKGKTDGPRIQYARIPLDTRTMARMSMGIKEMPESELGFRHILVCVCEFTNWMKTIPLADQKAQTIAMALCFKICCEYGTPKAIICDEAPAFQSVALQEYFKALNIQPIYISPMNHGSNRSERYIRTLNDIITKSLVGTGSNWPLYVPSATFAMNCQVSQVTGFSPFQMVYNKQPPDKLSFDFDPTKSEMKVDTPLYMIFMDQRKLLINQMIMRRKKYEAESQLTRESRKYPDVHGYAVGDLVLINHSPSSVLKAPSRKLKRDWVGLFKIQAIIDYSHYMISDWTGQLSHKRFHVNRLKPFSLSLGKVKDGKLQTVQNTRELFRIWRDIKEDIAVDKNSRHTQT